MGRQPSQVFAFNDPSKTIGICVPVVRCYLCVCIFVCLYFCVFVYLENPSKTIGIFVSVTRCYLCVSVDLF